MDDDLTVFSWNLRKKSYGGMTSTADTVKRVVDGISGVVDKGPQGADTPFVGFLLEIVGVDDNVARICRTIKRQYHKATGKRISVTSQNTDGSAHTQESIIVMSRGTKVTSSKFNVQEGLARFIEDDKANAARRFGERQVELAKRFRPRKDHPYQSKEEHFRTLNREPEWFRNGTIAEVKHAGRKLRIASVHAPGPDVSDKVEQVVDTIVNSAAGQEVDILIGDLNRRGAMPATHFEDLSRDWTSGTTFGKNDPEQLGTTRWDRVLARNDRRFDIASPDPVAITRPANLGAPLTDHALVFARVTRRTARTPPVPTEPFTFNTPAPNIAGADLHSLEASRAMVQPADPTLLYEAASDRKSTSEQLQKQLEDNPLTSPSTEPASDPLSPPSATSPLTEPPPTTTTGTDSAMEESAEAMEAMAAEGEEIAEVAELVLL
ncbi:hypothetical protein [Caulobacter sp. NIBR1757]|uniref:hypothetical protein n=1 Tax=Caulobacter sp. NIBR1757 TaxID=3016000 RepID=UPI0022F03939|nr:hypothetical protein [Caulobacter sp. NIBR1757]WGM37711.1 hypothetical protein AMEJIAPC_00611 [Caulobacter sp. NIBR1757]